MTLVSQTYQGMPPFDNDKINVSFPVLVQVDLVCHGKTDVFPDRDGSDPYTVS